MNWLLQRLGSWRIGRRSWRIGRSSGYLALLRGEGDARQVIFSPGGWWRFDFFGWCGVFGHRYSVDEECCRRCGAIWLEEGEEW